MEIFFLFSISFSVFNYLKASLGCYFFKIFLVSIVLTFNFLLLFSSNDSSRKASLLLALFSHSASHVSAHEHPLTYACYLFPLTYACYLTLSPFLHSASHVFAHDHPLIYACYLCTPPSSPSWIFFVACHNPPPNYPCSIPPLFSSQICCLLRVFFRATPSQL